MSQSWCRKKMNDLRDRNLRDETMDEIRARLSKGTEEEVVMNFLQSPEMFEYLEEGDNKIEDQSDIAFEILTICMSFLNLDTPDCTQPLLKFLKHKNLKVRSKILHELVKCLRKNPTITSLDLDLTMAIFSCLDELDTSVGAVATEILSQVLMSDGNNEIIKNELLKRCKSGAEICCRVYEICVNLAKKSSSKLSEVEPILNKMLEELNSDDIFLRLNILELLTSLAEQNHGLVYLESKQIFEKVGKQVEQISDNPLHTLLIPGFMKFFGKIAYYQPQKIINGYPNMIECIFDSILSEDLSILPTALDTLGNLANTSQGKCLLEKNYSEKLGEIFKKFSKYLNNFPTDLKIRVLNTLDVAFQTEGSISEEINAITKKWYECLAGSSNLNILLQFCKNPFPDIKLAALSLVKTLCHYHWGQLAFRNTAGFVEYMLDRRVEFNQDALYLKYDINKILSETVIFDVQILLQLKTYVEEGVNYVQPIMEIAVEGD